MAHLASLIPLNLPSPAHWSFRMPTSDASFDQPIIPHSRARSRPHRRLVGQDLPDLFSAAPRYTPTMHPRPHDNCYWVIPGRLIAGEYPGASDSVIARRRVADIAQAGVRHFVDLTEAHELAPYHSYLSEFSLPLDRPVAHERWPIRDVDVPHSADHANKILDRIDALMSVEAVPYVHCWGGIGRTGTVVGCWLVRHGRSGEDALDVIAGHWSTVAKRHRHPHSPETDAQRRFILEWAQHDRLLRQGGK